MPVGVETSPLTKLYITEKIIGRAARHVVAVATTFVPDTVTVPAPTSPDASQPLRHLMYIGIHPAPSFFIKKQRLSIAYPLFILNFAA